MSGSGLFQRKRQKGSGEAGDPLVFDSSSSDGEGPDTETAKMLTGLKRPKQKHVDGSLNKSMGTELLRTIQLLERELATLKQETEVAKQRLVENKLHEEEREMRMKRDQNEITHLRKELAAHQKQLRANERTFAEANKTFQHEKARLENAVAAQTETNNNLKKELQASNAQIRSLEEQLRKEVIPPRRNSKIVPDDSSDSNNTTPLSNLRDETPIVNIGLNAPPVNPDSETTAVNGYNEKTLFLKTYELHLLTPSLDDLDLILDLYLFITNELKQEIVVLTCGWMIIADDSEEKGKRLILTFAPNAPSMKELYPRVLDDLNNAWVDGIKDGTRVHNFKASKSPKTKKFPNGRDQFFNFCSLPSGTQDRMMKNGITKNLNRYNGGLNVCWYLPVDMCYENQVMRAFATSLKAFIKEMKESGVDDSYWNCGVEDKKPFGETGQLGHDVEFPTPLLHPPPIHTALGKFWSILRYMVYLQQKKPLHFSMNASTLQNNEDGTKAHAFHLPFGTHLKVMKSVQGRFETCAKEAFTQHKLEFKNGVFKETYQMGTNRHDNVCRLKKLLESMEENTGTIVSVPLDGPLGTGNNHAFVFFKKKKGDLLILDGWNTKASFNDLSVAGILKELRVDYTFLPQRKIQGKEPTCVLIAQVLLQQLVLKAQPAFQDAGIQHMFEHDQEFSTHVQAILAYLISHMKVCKDVRNDHYKRV